MVSSAITGLGDVRDVQDALFVRRRRRTHVDVQRSVRLSMLGLRVLGLLAAGAFVLLVSGRSAHADDGADVSVPPTTTAPATSDPMSGDAATDGADARTIAPEQPVEATATEPPVPPSHAPEETTTTVQAPGEPSVDDDAVAEAPSDATAEDQLATTEAPPATAPVHPVADGSGEPDRDNRVDPAPPVPAAVAPAAAEGPVVAVQVPIAAQIDRAVQAGQRSATIEPGEYQQDAGLHLGDHHDFTLNAYGVTLVMTRNVQALSTGNSNNLTINGLTINYDPLPFTQGRITAIAPGFTSMEVQVSAGYPRKLGLRMDVWNPETRLPRAVIFDAEPAWVDETGGVIRSLAPVSALVGDIVTYTWGPESGAPFAITVDGANTVFHDVTLHAAPGMGFMNASGEGNTRLDHFQVVPGPPPPRADEAPILSTNWDAIHFQSVKQGPTVVNSKVVNAGDDSMSIQGIGPVRIIATAGNTITATTFDQYHRVYVGDRLAQWVDGPQAIVTKVTAAAEAHTYLIELDRTSPWTAGTEITDLDRRGSGFVFANNYIQSSWRGLLLKTSNGIIANNWIQGSSAIAVSPEDGWTSHANAGGHLIITGNTFTSAAWAEWLWNTTQVGALSINGVKPGENEYSDPNITITDNTFQDVRGLNLQIKGASDAVIERNTFTGPHQTPPGWQGGAFKVPTTAVVYVTQSDHVSFVDNTIDWVGPYSITQVVVAADASNVTGLPDGVRVVHPFVATQAANGYTLTNRNSGLPLGLAAGSATSGASAAQGTASDAAAQRWSLVPSDQRSVLIRNVQTGSYLTAATTSGSTKVTLENMIAQPGGSSQRWQLLDVKNGYSKLVNVATGHLLAIGGGSVASGSIAIQWPNAGLLDQVWLIRSASPVLAADDPPLVAQVGAPYGPYRFAATGDPAPAFRVSWGSLPSGLTLDPASGALSGVPIGVGDSTFAVSASSAGVETIGRSHTVRVRAAAPVLTSDDPPLVAHLGAPYGPYRFAATGDPAPTFRVSSGSLPGGLTLDPASGVLSGVPTGDGDSTFAVSAVSAGVETVGRSHTLRVQAAAPVAQVDSPAIVQTIVRSHALRVRTADGPGPALSPRGAHQPRGRLPATGTSDAGGIALLGALSVVTGLVLLNVRAGRRRLVFGAARAAQDVERSITCPHS